MPSNLDNPYDPDKRGQRKGHIAFNEAMLFTKQWPTDKMTHVISIKKFDAWAFKNGLYVNSDGTPVDRSSVYAADTIARLRNELRARINETGRSLAWRDTGRVPFQIDVLAHGVDYEMHHANSSIKKHAERMPMRINGFADAKVSRVNDLFRVVDRSLLSRKEQLAINGSVRVIRIASAAMTVTLDDLADKLKQIASSQKK